MTHWSRQMRAYVTLRSGILSRMSYDLAFWQGTAPRSDDEACAMFDELMDELEEAEDERPPTPAIQDLVQELESRWPEGHPSALGDLPAVRRCAR